MSFLLRHSAFFLVAAWAVTVLNPVSRVLNSRRSPWPETQSIRDLGPVAFEALFSVIDRGAGQDGDGRGRDISLQTRLMCRESCGCAPQPLTPRRAEEAWQTRCARS